MKINWQITLLFPAFFLLFLQSSFAQCVATSAFTSSTDSLCQGENITFTNASTGAVSYSWLDNGSQFSTATNPTFAFTSGGFHNVQLLASTGSCTDTNTQFIFVHSTPAVFFPAVSSICENIDPIALPAAFPAGGTYGGPGVSVNNFDPGAVGPGNYDLTYTFTDANGCTGADTVSITVHPVPVVTFTGMGGLCLDANAVALSGGSPGGGTYAGPGVSSNSFFPTLATVGSHTLFYTYTDMNGCGAGDTTIQEVLALPIVSLSSLPDVCDGSTPVPLSSGSPSGGTYSGLGVATNLFDPSISGAGNQSITYDYTDANGCSGQTTGLLTVHALPQVFFANLPDLCTDKPILSLSGGFPNGGVYSGTGVSSGNFNPMTNGPGNYPITYTFTDGNGCENSVTDSLVVAALPNVNFPALPPVCEGTSPVLLSGATPAGGTYIGNFIQNGSFLTALAGAGSHKIIYLITNGSGCSARDSLDLLINASPSVTLLPYPDLCENSSPLNLFGGIPGGGVYSGNGVVNGNFDATANGNGTWPITYTFTDNDGCVDSANTDLVVHTLPEPNLGPDTTICQEPPFLLFPGPGFIAFNWSNGLTDPLFYVQEDGNYSVTVSDQNLCLGADTVQVQILTPAFVDLGPDAVSLEATGLILDAGFHDSYAWSDGSGQRFLETTSSDLYWVIVTDSNGCTASDSIDLVLWPLGLDENSGELSGQIFPNPASSFLTFQLDNSSAQALNIEVFTLAGQMVSSLSNRIPGQNGHVKIDLEHLPPGVYFLVAHDGKHLFREKFTLVD